MKFEILILFSFISGILIQNPVFVIPFIPLFFIERLNKKLLLFLIIFFFLGCFSIKFHINNTLFPQNINFSKISSIEGEVISTKEMPFEKNIKIKVKKIFIKDIPYKSRFNLVLKTKEKKEFLPGEDLRILIKKMERFPSPKNPFDFNYKKFMERQGIFFYIKSESIKKIDGKNIKLYFSYLKKNIEKRIERYTKFNPDGCELIKLLTVGNDDPPDFLKELGIKTGIYHLFIISGIHIVFLIFFLKIIFIPFQKINNTHPKLFPISALSILWFYNILCGFRIPITRAVLMVSFYFLFEIFEKDIEALTSLIFSAIILLLTNPHYIYSTSFLLSFLSTAGILIFPKKLSLKNKNFLTNLFIISISAQLSILPIIFYNFGYFYPLEIINNLFFTPLVGIITIMSFISLFISFFFIPLNFITSIFLKSLVFISNFSPKVNIYFPLSFVFIYYFLFLILLLPLKKKKKFSLLFIIVLFYLYFQFVEKPDERKIIFFSSQNPIILIQNQNKGLLILKDKTIKPDYWTEILYKITKKEKIKIEKVFLIDEKSIENVLWISKFCENIYINELPNIPSFLFFNFNIKRCPEKIVFDNIEIFCEDGNILLLSGKFKILILFNKSLKENILKDKYLLVYPAEFKNSKKNEELIGKLKPLFNIISKNTKKFENFKSICKNYYLEESAVILNLKTGIVEYWREK